MKDKIESELLIFDFDCKPEEITKALGLEPTQVVLKGDIKREDPEGVGPPLLHKKNVWIMHFDIPTTLEFDDHLDLILKKLNPYAAAIAQLAGKYDGELSVYGFVRDADRMAIHLSKEHIHELAKLNLNLDVDIYPTAEE